MTNSLLRAMPARHAAALAALSALALASPGPALDAAQAAAPITVEASYRVAYGSLKVGEIRTTTRVDGPSYRIDGTFASGGVAKLFKKTSATVSGEGRIGKRAMSPRRFEFAYKSGEKGRARQIDFREGRATSITITPPYKKRDTDDWTVPSVADLERVLDPVSGLMAKGKTGEEVCGRTIRAFDGTTRLDITMRHSRTKPFRTKGYKGEVHVCSLSLKPVAGFKKGRDSVKEIAAIRGAEAVFAPVPGTDLHQIVELEVPTSIGKVSAQATRLRFGGV